MDELVNKTVKVVEDEIDRELEHLEKLTVDDLESLRQKRLKQMKEHAKQRHKYILLGHKDYTEITIGKEFFEITKKSERVICHFYDNTTIACKVFDKHLKLLAQKHVETKFVTMNVDKDTFLRTRLQIKVVPTLLMVKNSQVIGRISGLKLFDYRTDFNTALFEWHIAQFGIIDYKEDIKRPPDEHERSSDDE